MHLGNAWIQILTAISASLVTILVNQLIEYRKRVTPRVEYLASRAIPIKIEGKYYGAYHVTVSNPSTRKVSEVTVHLRAADAKLSVLKLSLSPGLNPEVSSDQVNSGTVQLTLPYLKRDEAAKITVLAESVSYVPETLEIKISSPNEVEISSGEFQKRRFSWTPMLLGVIGAFLIALAYKAGAYLQAYIDRDSIASSSTQQVSFRPDVRDIIISAASTAGLPKFAELYSIVQTPRYYEEADLAYSFAAASGKKEEIVKYRALLQFSLQNEPSMAPESQANVLYCMGKVEILVHNYDDAVVDFKNAIAKSKSTVEDRSRLDLQTRKFLIDKALL